MSDTLCGAALYLRTDVIENESGKGTLWGYTYWIEIELFQDAWLQREPQPTQALSWSDGWIGTSAPKTLPDEFYDAAERLTDHFCIDYLASNKEK